MTGHRLWKELYERTFTPEQRARMEAESERMFEEDERRRGKAPAAGGTRGVKDERGEAVGTARETKSRGVADERPSRHARGGGGAERLARDDGGNAPMIRQVKQVSIAALSRIESRDFPPSPASGQP